MSQEINGFMLPVGNIKQSIRALLYIGWITSHCSR